MLCREADRRGTEQLMFRHKLLQNILKQEIQADQLMSKHTETQPVCFYADGNISCEQTHVCVKEKGSKEGGKGG